ncbi:MAG: TolC family protein [Acidobacteriota bacterium]|nr:TolC family protein [Acidobacteriota bacterium]
MSKRNVLAVAVLVLAGAAAAVAAPPNPLTLKEAIEMALQNSGSMAVARIRAQVAQQQTRVNRSVFSPNLFTGTGAAYTYGFPSTPGGQAPSVFNLSYTQTIFNPPAKGAVKAAQARTEEQRVAINATRDDVIVRVTSAFLELDEVRHSLDLLRQERVSAQKVLDITNDRVKAGLELPIDATEAELTRAKIEEQIISLEGREEVLGDDLRTMTGLPDNMPIVLAPVKLPPETDLPAAQLLTLAIANSPDLRQAEMERQARLDELKGQRGGYWPAVDLVGQYMVLSKINNYDQYFRTFQRNNLNVGVQVQIPIFRSRTTAAIALASSQYQEAELELGNQRRALEIQVRQEARQSREQDAAREVARLELKLAQEKLAIAQSQFNQGKATLATVEQDRLDESEKWLNYLQVNFNGQKAQLQLMRTTGQLADLMR